ncbi:MAG: glycosyltransferase [Anaerolineae bacterium]|nr:glycosyltransferase [Anaerolineae bacterium]MBL8106487.1 glycosyltransferase [Anaerolineales bacterium]MCC7190602.1 glycosyltransferase [Anaerolineales bacterium]
MIYLVLSSVFCIGGIVVVYWLHSHSRIDIIVKPASPPQNAPLISICIPARNEEQNIRVCVESALMQNYPNFEIIVLDDRSTDATPRILAELATLDSRLHPISGSDLPSGWVGKPHALHQASTSARGEWLCFVDADTFLSPQALSSCYVKAMEVQADLFTTLHRQIMGSFWEKAVMPIVVTALSVGFNPRKVNDPTYKDAIASGQFILIRREVYEKIGGHASVRDQIVEDQALAERVKWSGDRLALADGTALISTRMYTSLSSMWEGWTKNMYLGLRGQPVLMWLGVIGASLALMAALLLPIWLGLGLLWMINGGGLIALIVLTEALTLWGAILIARGWAASQMGISPLYSLSTPLGAGIFAAMMIASAWLTLSGKGVSWRGRHYAQLK